MGRILQAEQRSIGKWTGKRICAKKLNVEIKRLIFRPFMQVEGDPKTVRRADTLGTTWHASTFRRYGTLGHGAWYGQNQSEPKCAQQIP